jgi:quercetin dioxygenase-like cupin family protein
MTTIKAADAPTFEVPGVTFTGLAAPSRGASETAVWKVCIQPGDPGVPHQLDREEVFVATRGVAVATLDDDEACIESGDALIVPAGTRFSLTATGHEPFEAVVALPVGGTAAFEGGEPFTPPWAE